MKKGYLTTTDKARIYYEDRGEGIPLVFIPGHMCTSRFFKKNAEALSQSYRVVTMDPRGFGNSSKVLHGNDVERNCDDIKELIEFLGLEHVVLLGWSLGGSFVMMYAHKYHEKHLGALGLIDAALFPFSRAAWNTYRARDYNMDEWCCKYGVWITDTELYYNNFIRRIDRGMTSEDREELGREVEKTPPWIGFAIHTDWCHTDTEQFLKELTVPVLLISGEEISMGRHYKGQIRAYSELHEFETGGHAMFWTECGQFNEILTNFTEHTVQREKERRA